MSKKKTKPVKMSVPEGMEFDTPYTVDHTLHNEHYWHTDRNIDPMSKNPKSFAQKLDIEITIIADLLKLKNENPITLNQLNIKIVRGNTNVEAEELTDAKIEILFN